MKKASKSLGIDVREPKIVFADPKNKKNVSAQDVIDVIKKHQSASIVLCFFDQRTSNRIYNQVKIICNEKLCIRTQFFSNWNPKFTKNIGNLSISSKVVMQMVAKQGHALWKVEKPHKLNTNGA